MLFIGYTILIVVSNKSQLVKWAAEYFSIISFQPFIHQSSINTSEINRMCHIAIIEMFQIGCLIIYTSLFEL